jgi:hypothetical protein
VACACILRRVHIEGLQPAGMATRLWLARPHQARDALRSRGPSVRMVSLDHGQHTAAQRDRVAVQRRVNRADVLQA